MTKRSIPDIRRSAEVSQKACAAIMGCARSTWARYERGLVARPRRAVTYEGLLEIITSAGRAQGSGIQLHIEDFGL